MRSILCPHCKTHRISVAQVPRDVVAILPCPSCGELAVLFRKRVFPIDRRLLEEGAREEKVAHIANIICDFLDAGLLPVDPLQALENLALSEDGGSDRPRTRRAKPSRISPSTPITPEEVERFAKIELQYLDDASYFRKHFG